MPKIDAMENDTVADLSENYGPTWFEWIVTLRELVEEIRRSVYLSSNARSILLTPILKKIRALGDAWKERKQQRRLSRPHFKFKTRSEKVIVAHVDRSSYDNHYSQYRLIGSDRKGLRRREMRRTDRSTHYITMNA